MYLACLTAVRLFLLNIEPFSIRIHWLGGESSSKVLPEWFLPPIQALFHTGRSVALLTP